MAKLTRVAIEEEETFEDLKSRLAIFGKHIDGFYRLLKAESVSASKAMVLYNPKTKAFISDSKEIRKQLKLAPSAKNVTLKPADVPKGMELYIQSTSSKRKLIGGYAILRGLETEDTLSSAPPAKKAKLVETDVEESEEKPRETPKKSGPTTRKEKEPDLWLMKWKDFDNLPDIDSDDFSEMIECTDMESRDSVDDCDQPVPVEFLEKLHSQILGVLRDGGLKWSKPSYKKLEGRDVADEPVLWVWDSANRRPKQALRLLYYASACSNDVIIALEQQKDFAVIFHVLGGHPGIITNGFIYSNSDGSGDTSREPMPGTPTPDLVLIRLLNYVWEHGHDIYH